MSLNFINYVSIPKKKHLKNDIEISNIYGTKTNSI